MHPLSRPQWCYDTVSDCNSGPNACTADQPCTLQLSLCATGVTAGASAAHNFFCLADMPLGALPSGSGLMCYTDFGVCLNGPNRCSNVNPCILDLAFCGSGIAGGTKSPQHGWFCPSDLVPNAAPNGAPIRRQN